MVDLDHALIFHARRLINGANVHYLRELIFVYNQAVILHNAGWPTHVVYQDQYEKTLRQFVFEQTVAQVFPAA
jgi:hypothetical protein